MYLIWQILFVIGVIMMAIAVNRGPGWFSSFAWILWAVAAVIWLTDGTASFHH